MSHLTDSLEVALRSRDFWMEEALKAAQKLAEAGDMLTKSNDALERSVETNRILSKQSDMWHTACDKAWCEQAEAADRANMNSQVAKNLEASCNQLVDELAEVKKQRDTLSVTVQGLQKQVTRAETYEFVSGLDLANAEKEIDRLISEVTHLKETNAIIERQLKVEQRDRRAVEDAVVKTIYEYR